MTDRFHLPVWARLPLWLLLLIPVIIFVPLVEFVKWGLSGDFHSSWRFVGEYLTAPFKLQFWNPHRGR